VPSTDRPETLDLRERWEDVRRVALSRPGWRSCVDAGWEEEDLWHEVYLRCLARQEMPSRYDPRRAGVGRYLCLLTASILANLLEQRRAVKVVLEVSEECDRG
jgi:hypothetical protein